MPMLALSSWSVRHALGPMYPGLALTVGERQADHRFGAGALTLLDLPDAVRAAGMNAFDLCHFHFPRTDAAYLQAFSERLTAAGVRVLTLLVDEGDVSAANPRERERDLAGIRNWIDLAAQLGARYVRVAAGDGDARADPAAIERSAVGLAALGRHARSRSVVLLTENWRALAMSPDHLLAVLDAAGDTVGLCADFGNYHGPEKYRALAAILPRARTIHAHAKAAWMQPGATEPGATNGGGGDLVRCLGLARAAGFAGTYVLIFDGNDADEEWAGIAWMAATVQEYCGASDRANTRGA